MECERFSKAALLSRTAHFIGRHKSTLRNGRTQVPLSVNSLDSFESDTMAVFLEKPRYYDAPDGEEPLDKIVSLQKRGFIAGLLIGSGDCLYFTDTKTALESTKCLAYWIVPLVGMGTTFAAVTFAATRFRKKDEAKNYALGALACSPILHAWTKSTRMTLWGTAILMAFAAGFKQKEQMGVKAFPDVVHIYGQYMYDFTIMKDVNKDWQPVYKKMY